MNLPFFLLVIVALDCIGLISNIRMLFRPAFKLLLQERKQVQIPGSLDDMSVCLSDSFSSDSDHVRVEHLCRRQLRILLYTKTSQGNWKFLNF